jgi:DNA-binding protein H-NS
MATSRVLKGKLKNPAEEAAAVRVAQLQAVIDEVLAKVVEYSLTEADLFDGGRARRNDGPRGGPSGGPNVVGPNAGPTPAVARYRDPKRAPRAVAAIALRRGSKAAG